MDFDRELLQGLPREGAGRGHALRCRRLPLALPRCLCCRSCIDASCQLPARRCGLGWTLLITPLIHLLMMQARARRLPPPGWAARGSTSMKAPNQPLPVRSSTGAATSTACRLASSDHHLLHHMLCLPPPSCQPLPAELPSPAQPRARRTRPTTDDSLEWHGPPTGHLPTFQHTTHPPNPFHCTQRRDQWM